MSLQLPSIDIFEIRSAKNGLDVPYINGVHLHSIYNPTREAETLANNNLDVIKEKRYALVLGLGMAYHVQKIIDSLSEYHDQYHVMVIDPCIQSYKHCEKMNLIDEEHVTVMAGISVKNLYQNSAVIDFLIAQPSVIAHPASFNLYNSYYKDFLSYRAPTQLADVAPLIEDRAIQDFLANAPADSSLGEWITTLRKEDRGIESKEALLLFAFNKIASLGKLQDASLEL
ncbi:MAG: hypothetical protein HN353_03390 [Bdellovibrionales bacterium]|jgi:hypothetical protein|nr:hypothetical protein [Bdellovibrionales bacterium]MBT3526072.1 hypothetical protein [Bdellovibrionales bacterium]MBT7669114.1 hypothetical protein [Bdellovibrionales bacterium]